MTCPVHVHVGILCLIVRYVSCTTYDQSYQGINDINTVSIPAGTTHLILHHNNLLLIPANYFTPSEASVTKLEFNHNQISVIEDFSFQYLSNVQVILLAANDLQIITTNMFYGLTSKFSIILA